MSEVRSLKPVVLLRSFFLIVLRIIHQIDRVPPDGKSLFRSAFPVKADSHRTALPGRHRTGRIRRGILRHSIV